MQGRTVKSRDDGGGHCNRTGGAERVHYKR